MEAALRGDEGAPSLERIEVVQPALFALSLGLAAVLRSFGVVPSAVVGHSQGEVAAAAVAGALSLEDAARVIAARSQLQQRLAGTGAMATTELSACAVERRLRHGRYGDLSVAVVNMASSTVVAGSPAAVDAWVAQAERDGIFWRRVASDVAGHTANMDPILGELRERIAGLSPRPGALPMISTLTGEPIAFAALDADYFCRNVREPVRLDRALSHLSSDGFDAFLEISPHPVLRIALAEAAGERGCVVGALERGRGDLGTLLGNLGVLHTEGLDVDWRRVVVGSARLAALPTYAFQRQRYWLSATAESALRAAPPAAGEDPGDTGLGSKRCLSPGLLPALDPEERDARIRGVVDEELRAVLGLDAGDEVAWSACPRDLGLTSLTSVELSRVLAARLGARVSAASVLRAVTLEDVVGELMRALAPTASDAPAPRHTPKAHILPAGRWLVPIQRAEQPAFRLVCFPYSGASAAAFRGFRAGLPRDVEVWAVELPGRGRREGEPPVERLEEIVQGVDAASSSLPELPLFVFGHSLGAILGFEFVMHRLARGKAVRHLFVSGAAAPHHFRFPLVTRLSDDELLAALEQLGFAGVSALRLDPELRRTALAAARSDLRLVADYAFSQRAPLAIPITALSAGSDALAPFSEVEAWHEVVASDVDFHHRRFSGGHARCTAPTTSPSRRPTSCGKVSRSVGFCAGAE